jgi:capsular polysaccharide transport system permease protein
MAGDNASIASNMGGYDELVFEKTIAEKAWSAAETARIAARANSERQHLYLQAVVDPNTPDVATYPRRWLYLALTALVAGVAFSIVRALRQFAMEHTL